MENKVPICRSDQARGPSSLRLLLENLESIARQALARPLLKGLKGWRFIKIKEGFEREDAISNNAESSSESSMLSSFTSRATNGRQVSLLPYF